MIWHLKFFIYNNERNKREGEFIENFKLQEDRLGIIPTVELKTLPLKVISAIMKTGIENNELLNNLINKHDIHYPVEHLLYQLYNNYCNNLKVQKFLLSTFGEKVLYDEFDYYDIVIKISNEYFSSKTNCISIDEVLDMISKLDKDINNLKNKLNRMNNEQSSCIIEKEKKYDTAVLNKWTSIKLSSRKSELVHIKNDLEEFVNYPYFEDKYKEFSLYMQKLQNYILEKLADKEKYEINMFIDLYNEIKNSEKWNLLSDNLKYQIKLLILNYAKIKNVDIDINILQNNIENDQLRK